MASLLDETDLIIRVYKRAVGNPEFVWVNTYEAWCLAPPTSFGAYATMLDAFVAAEATFHLPSVEFIRATVSTWAPDSRPYDPQAFLVNEYGDTFGQNVVSSDPMPRNVVLSVRRHAVSGRSGRLFYRGCLVESHVQTTNAFDPRLTEEARTTFSTSLSAAHDQMKAAVEAVGGVGSQIVLLRDIGQGAPERREVVDFVVHGVTVNRSDHRYFDRATPSAP